MDVFIPTYNEPLEVLAPSIAAAVGIRYPHRTLVLDDGRRPWVRSLCNRLGAEYITRDGNEGAKAGNLNAALRVTKGELFAVLDADFIATPRLIDDLVGYFVDPKVAIVQGPQEFYNVDSFQHASGRDDIWHEQRMFFDVIQLGKNRSNSAFWSGAPSMLRRRPIESIGMIPTSSVTEDIHTSIMLHRQGWKTVYHPGVIAVGLAPDDYNGFILQRLRWAQGAMQVIRLEWRSRGLSLGQWLNYVASTGTYFDAYRKATLLIIVPAIVLTDQLPVSCPAWTFLAAWALQFALLGCANAALGRGFYRYLQTELFDSLKMFASIWATPTLIFSRAVRFKVTPKGEAGERRWHPFLAPFLGILGAYGATMVIGATRLGGDVLTTENPTAMAGALVWAAVITVSLAAVAGHGYRHVSRRRNSRISARLGGTLSAPNGSWGAIDVVLDDLSMRGCAFEGVVPLGMGDSVDLAVADHDEPFRCVVRSVALADRGRRFGVEFQLQPEQEAGLARLFAAAVIERWAPELPVKAPRRPASVQKAPSRPRAARPHRPEAA